MTTSALQNNVTFSPNVMANSYGLLLADVVIGHYKGVRQQNDKFEFEDRGMEKTVVL